MKKRKELAKKWRETFARDINNLLGKKKRLKII